MSYETGGHEALSAHAVEFLQIELLSLQETHDDLSHAAQITMALIEWHLGTRDSLGEEWDTAHNPNYYGVPDADLTMLMEENGAARWLALGLADTGELELAERTLNLILASTLCEPPDERAAAQYVDAELAARANDLKRELEARRKAETNWQQALKQGAGIDVELRDSNYTALRKCEMRAHEREQEAARQRRSAAVSRLGPIASANEFGIQSFRGNVLPEEASDAANGDIL